MWAGEVMQGGGVFCGQGEGKMGSRIHRRVLADARSNFPPYPLGKRTVTVPRTTKDSGEPEPPSLRSVGGTMIGG